jgi:hypothetical protein
LAGLALRGTRHDAFAGLHEKWGALIACSGWYSLGFLRHAWGWREGEARVQHLPVLLVAVLVAAAAWGAWRASRREVVALGPWFAFALVPVSVVLAGTNVGDGVWLWSACAWTALFMLNVFMIRAGLANGREGWVNLGLGFIALNIVTRYFDLFGTMHPDMEEIDDIARQVSFPVPSSLSLSLLLLLSSLLETRALPYPNSLSFYF